MFLIGEAELDDVLKLPATMDVARARAMVDDLMSRRGAPLSIDGSAVERVSALAVEVLIAGERQWAADDQPFGIAPMSPALSDAWSGLGLDPRGALARDGGGTGEGAP